ncbi:MAG: phosphopyruvate hydratase [Candidatus Bathyarchaeota archaeon]|nr:MAG: phosphopyruvate hydratase [Candidatus Bathyarchaeota archaeon]
MSTVIENITARKLFNSRGEETLEIDISTVSGFGRASAPAGASRGKAEVISYPKGKVDLARRQVEELVAPELIGRNANEQEEIDLLLHEIDGTEDFRNLGGNTAYAVSLAVAEAAATSYGMPLFQHLAGYFADELPCPLGNVLGGGKHAGGKTPDIQEFLVLPINAESFSDAASANVLVHQRIGSLLRRKDASFTGGRGEEGAWAPNIKSEQALQIVAKACDEVSEELSVECRIGLDIAASTLWKQEEELYVYDREGIKRNSGEQLDFLLSLIWNHNLIYVEDPFHENDFESFAELADKARGCLISGDDLFATSKKRLTRGIEISAGNAIIIKTNQVGTLTDAWEATELARKASYVPIMSHRSGETTDTHLAHLSVALHCPIIKTGVMGGTRVAKINELIRIEEILGDRTKMAVLSL